MLGKEEEEEEEEAVVVVDVHCVSIDGEDDRYIK